MIHIIIENFLLYTTISLDSISVLLLVLFVWDSRTPHYNMTGW